MTDKKAINILKKHQEHWERLAREKICSEDNGIETIKALEIAIKAIEKPEGKWLVTWHKALMSNWSNWMEYKCPVCNTSFVYDRDICSYTNYCPKCGAKMTGEEQLETKIS